jgi:ribose transport system substrate-binding protein
MTRRSGIRRRAFAVAAVLASMALLTGCSGGAAAPSSVKATPYPALSKPTINPRMSLDEAKSIVDAATKPSTKWDGPTTGPKAPTGLSIAYVSCNQANDACSNWASGVQQAGKLLDWKVTVIDGKGTVSGNLSAFQQALALSPAAIISSADATGLQSPIEQAVNRNIPVIGIHATAYPGPSPDLHLYDNIATNPADIGRTQAAYVLSDSNGKGEQLHMLDNSFEIARFKAKAAEEPVKNFTGAKFLGEINIPFSDMTTQIPSAVSGILSRYPDVDIYMTSCCDSLFPNVSAALRSSGVPTSRFKLVGADGVASAYDSIRKGEYQVATVPEPSTLFGFMAVDSTVRAFAGQKPAKYSPQAYLVTKANVDAEGGTKSQYIPGNGFACHYKNIWLGTNKSCSGS